jgi:trans-aconitate methyltransferase
MTNPDNSFDVYASDYDQALARGISASGEDKNYFARKRIEWLKYCLTISSRPIRRIMDFGCGTGSSAPFFFEILEVEQLIGTDRSPNSLAIAEKIYGSNRARFLSDLQYCPVGDIELVFSNGVFHHIPPGERGAAAEYVLRSLTAGGLFAFWENNPWNPATRYVMSRIPFDKDAIMLSAREAQQLLRNQGFEILRTDFLFIFPRALHKLRWIEFFCSRLPFGAQYQVLCRKPNK